LRKQMVGDNERRRALSRQARERGLQAGDTDATLGASKQIRHLDHTERDGPAPAGNHKPDSTRGGPAPPAAGTAQQEWPLRSPEPGNGVRPVPIGYRDLVSDVERRTGVDFQQARAGAEATVVALARALRQQDRERLLAVVPNELTQGHSVEAEDARGDLDGFLAEVARISRRTPEQARYQAEATLAALADQDAQLLGSLDVPADLRRLLGTGEADGRPIGPQGHTRQLTGPELDAALAELPQWSGTEQELSRTIQLPRENLQRVLERLKLMSVQRARGPQIARPAPDTAVLTVRTGRVGAVTSLDVELAHRIDAEIEAAGAGVGG